MDKDISYINLSTKSSKVNEISEKKQINSRNGKKEIQLRHIAGTGHDV